MMKHILATLAIVAAGICSAQSDCDLHIQVVTPDTEMAGADDAVASMLATRLVNALTHSGATADDSYGQLYLTGKFNDSFNETVPGPPMRTAVHTTLTLMVADVVGNKMFDSQSFELRGVGSSEQRAYINALNQLNGNNRQLRDFVERAKRKTISYFDKNYTRIIAKGKQAASMRDYPQAFYFIGLIPQCSVGYEEANRAMATLYQDFIDYEGTRLLNDAEAAFAMSPNAQGALSAYAFLRKIDPRSSAYGASRKFAEEVKKQTKAEYDFEVHEKYQDQKDFAFKSLDAARQIGVAYGSNQKNNTTNILWK